MLSDVRSGHDKTPSCSRQPGSPCPPPCHLHRATRLRSHPSPFASTAPPSLPTTSVDQKAKASPRSPPQLQVAIFRKQKSRLTVSSLGGKDNPPPSVILIVHQQRLSLLPLVLDILCHITGSQQQSHPDYSLL